MGPLCPCPNSKKPMKKVPGASHVDPTDPGPSGKCKALYTQAEYQPGHSAHVQERTDNSWGPWAIGDHGAPVSLLKLKKAYEKGTRGILWGPLLTPGPQAVLEFPNGQSAPA
ncbi:unnamed protein product, partial [Staurois parvus]